MAGPAGPGGQTRLGWCTGGRASRLDPSEAGRQETPAGQPAHGPHDDLGVGSARKEQYVKTVVSTIGRSLLTVTVIATTALAAAITHQMAASAATQATYYVDPSGNDGNPGTITSPFRTLQHARDVVRTVNANMTGDINVFLRGGTYPVSSSIDFGS